MALLRETNQINTHSDKYSSYAVDGNLQNKNIFQCAHTGEDSAGSVRWWYVKLDSEALVHYIDVTNRGDCCCKYIQLVFDICCNIKN